MTAKVDLSKSFDIEALKQHDIKHAEYRHIPKAKDPFRVSKNEAERIVRESQQPKELVDKKQYRIVKSRSRHWNKKSSKSDLKQLAEILSRSKGKKKKKKSSAKIETSGSEKDEDIDRQPKSDSKPKKSTVPKIDAPAPKKSQAVYDDPLASDSDSMFSDEDDPWGHSRAPVGDSKAPAAAVGSGGPAFEAKMAESGMVPEKPQMPVVTVEPEPRRKHKAAAAAASAAESVPESVDADDGKKKVT